MKTSDVVANVPYAVRELVRQGVKGYGATIDPKLAKERFDPHLYSVWQKHKPAKGQMNAEQLEKVYTEEAKAKITESAGIGRSAAWVSKEEASHLPKGLKSIYDAARSHKESAVARAAALREPFPSGIVEPDLFFGRFLAMDRKRAVENMLHLGDVIAKLPEIATKGATTAGDFEIIAAKDGKDLEIEGRKLYNYGGDTKLAVKKGDDVVLVGWDDFGGGISKLTMSRYDLRDRRSDPRGVTTYEPKDGSMQALLEKYAPKGHAKKSEDEKLFDRVGGDADATAAAMLAKAVIAATKGFAKSSEAIDLALARTEKKAAEQIPEFAKKAKLLDHYRSLAEAVKKNKGEEITLGDMDTYVRVSDKFEKSTYDEDDNEKQVTLVEGKGPLLIVDNIFGGLGHAIPLSSLEKGELEVFISHETSKRGKLHIGADGKAISTPDDVSAYRVANDLLGYLPAALEV
jgi:hypothetical protein